MCGNFDTSVSSRSLPCVCVSVAYWAGCELPVHAPPNHPRLGPGNDQHPRLLRHNPALTMYLTADLRRGRRGGKRTRRQPAKRTTESRRKTLFSPLLSHSPDVQVLVTMILRDAQLPSFVVLRCAAHMSYVLYIMCERRGRSVRHRGASRHVAFGSVLRLRRGRSLPGRSCPCPSDRNLRLLNV